MPKVCRVNDLISGPSGQGQATTGSGTVKIENLSVCREGDMDNVSGTHHFVANSSTVFIENKKVIMVGDMDDAGNRVITGSSTVFIG